MVLPPEVGSKSLPGWVSSSLPEEEEMINAQVLWFDSRCCSWVIDLANLVKQAVSQGVG